MSNCHAVFVTCTLYHPFLFASYQHQLLCGEIQSLCDPRCIHHVSGVRFAADVMVALTAIDDVNSKCRKDAANDSNGVLVDGAPTNAERIMYEQSSCKIMHPARCSYYASPVKVINTV